MELSINVGDNYAMVVVDAANDLDRPVELGGGRWILPGGFLDLPAHWKEWLGTIRTEAIEQSGLILLVTARGDGAKPTQAVMDSQALQARHMRWGLLGSGHVRLEGFAWTLAGHRSADAIEVLHVADLDAVLLMPGPRSERVTEQHVRRAGLLGEKLGDLVRVPPLQRIARAASVFAGAFSEPWLGERIHQFVRAVDGITCARRQKQFVERCEVLVGEGHAAECGELYLMRNNAEHLNDPEMKLPLLPLREDLVCAHLRELQAEALARHALTRLLERPAIWRYFHEGAESCFWDLPGEEQRRLWGPPVDLGGLAEQFDSSAVPNERLTG